jgi:hypothetical protein
VGNLEGSRYTRFEPLLAARGGVVWGSVRRLKSPGAPPHGLKQLE